MKVVVTGGAGRLGRSVVDQLIRAHHDVVSLDLAVGDAGGDVQRYAIDLTDEEATRTALSRLAPDAVVHLAAIAVPFSAPESVIWRVNTQLVMNVVGAAIAAGARKVLAASSPTVVGYGSPAGWAPDRLPIDERSPTRPWNAYALSKLAIEETVAMFARSEPQVVLGAFRPCFVVAPEEWTGAPTQQGHTIKERLDDPSLAAVSLFNYVDARDAGRFVVDWVERSDPGMSGDVFFVSADDPLCRGDVRAAIAEALPAAATAAAALGPRQSAFSSTRATEALGWAPRRSWRTELVGEPAGPPEEAGR